jgi:type I restriction enzyme R subunit
MATGSGKTRTAISSTYRLIKSRMRTGCFLVDRANRGRQAFKEFQQYTTPDDGRKFTELYNVQHLTSNKIDPVARVVITTIQRLYSMLQGKELDPALEEGSGFDTARDLVREPVPVAYNASIPIEFFDIIFIDECHRSIYSLWRQVSGRRMRHALRWPRFVVGILAQAADSVLSSYQSRQDEDVLELAGSSSR